MNVKEMHIDVNQQLQRIDAHAVDWFEPEEIDVALNREMVRFIKTHYEPKGNKHFEGFEQSSKRIQDLRHLIVPDYTDNTFVNSKDDTITEFPFPSDLMFLHRVRPRTNFVPCSDSVSTAKKRSGFSYVSISFDFFYKQDSLSSFDVGISGAGGLSSFLSSSFKNGISNYNFPEDWTVFIKDLVEDLNRSNSIANGASWESYKNIYDKDRLIIAVSDIFNNVIVDVDGNQTTYYILKSSMDLFEYDGSDSLTTKYTRGKFSQSHDVDILLEDPFNTTGPDLPLFTIRNNYIDFYLDQDFFIDKARIDYIRWPKRISKARNQDCELPESTHDEIVASTVAHLSGVIQDQRYQILESEARSAE